MMLLSREKLSESISILNSKIEEVTEQEIPLPPVKEQKSMVERIDGLLDLVQQLQLLKTEDA